jgi:hypothetical protein
MSATQMGCWQEAAGKQAEHLLALEEELKHLSVMAVVEVLEVAAVAVHCHRLLGKYASLAQAKKVESEVIQANVFLML